MKSKLAIALVAFVLIGGGIGAYVLTQNDSNNTTSNSSDNNNQESTSDSVNPTFNPLASTNESFVATMEVVSSNESENFSGTIERAKSGDLKFSGVQAGQNVELYLTTAGENIVCQEGQCYKLSDGTSSLEDLDVTVGEDDLTKYRESAQYKGKEACVSGTCNVWEYTDEDGTKVTVYIASDTNRIIEMLGVDSDGSKLKINYDYKDVTVTIPTEYETLPGGI